MNVMRVLLIPNSINCKHFLIFSFSSIVHRFLEKYYTAFRKIKNWINKYIAIISSFVIVAYFSLTLDFLVFLLD